MANKIYIVKPGDTLFAIANKLKVSMEQLLDSNAPLKLNPDKFKAGQRITIPKDSPIIMSDNLNSMAVELGSLSSKYEVGNHGPESISSGVGDSGGQSYGLYQMTSRPNGGTVLKFINQYDFPFKTQFQGLTPATQKFNDVWKSVAKTNTKEFRDYQHEFIKKYFFDILVLNIKNRKTVNILNHSNALQNVIWSTAVQHGPATHVVDIAIDNLKGLKEEDNSFDSSLIKAIYNERGRKNSSGELVYFSHNSPAVQKGVANRFITEEKDALRMLNS